MNKKNILLFFIIILSHNAFAQVKNTYKGVVVDINKAPIDVFSIVIFNNQDSTEQLYANTFSNGDFEFEFNTKKKSNYGAYILSIGYEDTYLNLENLHDTITFRNRLIKIDDAIIKGQREVKTEMGTYGGIAYDVSNTYLSEMGESTTLLNFIPGVAVSDMGKVKLLSNRDNVVVYINNIKMNDNQKLLSLKSEDIKSVEVINSPGVRFKGAKAVLYIRTNRAFDGFSTRVTGLYYVGERMTYASPSAEITFTKKKISLSASYNYTLYDSFTSSEEIKEIDEATYKGGWQIKENNEYNSNSDTHWYSANINYNINSKNTLVAEYTGSANNSTKNNISKQPISTANQGIIYNNTINQDNDPENINNRVHLNYIGEYSEKFDITADVDFSNKTNKNNFINSWDINDVLTDEKTNTNFNQKEKNSGYAITSEILFNNNINDKHTITYGLEHSFLHNDVSSIIDEENLSEYYLNSNFLKLFAEYTLHINSNTNLSLGINYMYSNLKDNNNDKHGNNYNNIAPTLSFQYYNPENEIGINYSIEYENYQPTANSLNDITVTILSPYEINRGNKNLQNSIGYFSNLSFSYKKFGLNLKAMILTNDLSWGTIIEDNNGKPLFVNTEVNYKKPITNIDFGASYSNNISFWTTNIYASVTYALFNLEQAPDVFEKTSGFLGEVYINNQFKLPHNFYIYLNGYYNSKGYRYIMLYGEKFNMDIAIEKRFFKNNLSIKIKGSGILSEKENTFQTKGFGVYNNKTTKSYGTRRFFSINASWRFNNHKRVQQAKDNEYLNML